MIDKPHKVSGLQARKAKHLPLTAVLGLLCGVAALLSLNACEVSTPALPDAGYAYFPLEKGMFSEYDVVETTYTLSAAPSSRTYQIREVVSQVFTDLSAQESYRIERFSRTNANQIWRLDSVWTAKRTAHQAIRTENNLSYVKLVFPIGEGTRWNGNALNGLGGKEASTDEYLMENLHKRHQINDQIFDKTLTVRQQNDSTLVGIDRRTEIYAAQIGLIYKEFTQLAYCYQASCLGKGQVDFGTRIIQRIKRYGKEP